MQKSKLKKKCETLVYSCMLVSRFVTASDQVIHFIACQICLESAFFLSRLCRESNNFTGMKFPSLRVTTAIGKDVSFAKYDSYNSCMADFMYRHLHFGLTRKDLSSIDAYSDFLVRTKYCSSPDYIPAIKKLYHEYFKTES